MVVGIIFRNILICPEISIYDVKVGLVFENAFKVMTFVNNYSAIFQYSIFRMIAFIKPVIITLFVLVSIDAIL